MLDDQIIAEKFEISNYLIELAKKRRKNFNFSVIKKKLSISDNQLESIENGKIDFMPFPFNYHITKQYVEFVDTRGAYKIKEEFFSNVRRTNHPSNEKPNSRSSYTFTNLFAKL